MIPPTAAGIIGTEFMIAYLASTATYILNTTKETLRYPQKLCALIPIWRAREYSKYRTPLALDLSYFNLFRFHVQTVWRKQGVSLTNAWPRPENLHWFEAAAYHSKQAVLPISHPGGVELIESQYTSKCSSHRVRQAGAGGWSWSGVREKYCYLAGSWRLVLEQCEREIL